MTPLDRITEALRYLETVESHGGHLGGILPDIFTVEDLRVVVGMAGEAGRLREVLELARLVISPTMSPNLCAAVDAALAKTEADSLSLETCAFRLQCRVDAGRDSVSISPGFAKEIIAAMNRARAALRPQDKTPDNTMGGGR